MIRVSEARVVITGLTTRFSQYKGENYDHKIQDKIQDEVLLMNPRYHDEIAVNGCFIDYLTLTSFVPQAMADIENVCSRLGGEAGGPRKRMQYEGRGTNHWFVGFADQGGRRHGMAQVAGYLAQEVFQDLQESHYDLSRTRCRRIDLQATVTMPQALDLVRLGCLYREGRISWKGQGHSPNVEFFAGKDKLDTLYFGSRVSRRYFRIYIKEGESYARYVRFEIEYKRELAEEVLKSVSDDPDSMGAILAAEFVDMPVEIQAALTGVWDVLGSGKRKVRVVRTAPGDEKTFLWLLDTVLPTIKRLLKSRYGTELATVLKDILTLSAP